jgi:hypothetical protein
MTSPSDISVDDLAPQAVSPCFKVNQHRPAHPCFNLVFLRPASKRPETCGIPAARLGPFFKTERSNIDVGARRYAINSHRFLANCGDYRNRTRRHPSNGKHGRHVLNSVLITVGSKFVQ